MNDRGQTRDARLGASRTACAEAKAISVVDDDESVRDSTSTLLRSVGYRVGTFASAEQFLESGALGETDCLILDVRMPGMSGLELQRRLKSSDICVPIVFVSAYDELQNRRRAIEAGAVDFLSKPFEASSLVIAIQSALIRRTNPGEEHSLLPVTQMSQNDCVQLEHALRAAKIAVWDLDIASGKAFYSPELNRLCGLAPGAFGGSLQSVLQLIHPEDRAQIDRTAKKLLANGSELRSEFRIVRADGGIRWVETFGALLRDALGQPRRFIGMATDITERKLLEQELRESNEELVYFSYAASHDLQEPLRAVKVYSQLLQELLNGQQTDDLNKCLEFILSGVDHLETLLQDLRIHTEVSQEDKATPDCVDSDAILQDALGNLSTAIADNDAVVTHDQLPLVIGRKVHLIELFQNLLSNAIKYRSSDPPVIHISAVRSGEEWVFSFRDNGVGIDKDDARDIFRVFKRLRRDLPGSGMGLAICKRIVERAGGRIWVQSEPGRGSTFYFTVPAAHRDVRLAASSSDVIPWRPFTGTQLR